VVRKGRFGGVLKLLVEFGFSVEIRPWESLA